MFTAKEKLRLLGEADRAQAFLGGRAIVRREGPLFLGSDGWRRQRDAGAFEALKPGQPRPQGPAPNPLAAEHAQLKRTTGS